MPLIVTKTLLSTFPSIVGDYYTDLNEETQKDYIPSVYEGLEYELNVKFEYEDEFEVPVAIQSANLLSDFSEFGVDITKIAQDTFKVKGAFSNVITDAYYEFVMRDGTVKKLTADTKEDYRAIIYYKMPAQTYVTKQIQWDLTFAGEISISPSLTQYVYWVFSSARDNLKTLVASRP